VSELAQQIVAFVQAHHGWAAPIMFALAFCESFAFISVFLPTASILVGFGMLIGASGLDFWPAWLAATLGAFVAHWLAYDIAFRFKEQIARLWPLSHNPALLGRGVTFFRRWGLLAVFFGRFLGPLRAVMPLAAGLCEMPWISFQTANLASAILWTGGMLAPGVFGMRWFTLG
jgi:membrane protein DedA with SNARE-associated domain